MKAWIERNDGSKIPVEADCSFGRSNSNTVQISSRDVSRRHAHIHAQHADNRTEYWLLDLGSTNGTLCNGRRVVIPGRLRSNDRIQVGEEQFVFRIEKEVAETSYDTDTPPTIPARASRQCWLLMIDIKQYTRLTAQVETNVLAQKIGGWIRKCQDTIESCNGAVDKFLGDAIFAYWLHSADAPKDICNALRQLVDHQSARDPDFRIVLHFGRPTIEGGAGGADNLTGEDVVVLFRLEKVCAHLQLDCVMTEAASQLLPAPYAGQSIGNHRLEKFERPFELFSLMLPGSEASTQTHASE